VTHVGLTTVHVRGFRSLRDASFRPGAISAIVGEPSAGKSNLLAAIWALLDPEAAPLTPSDVTQDDGRIRIVGDLTDGSAIVVDGEPHDADDIGAGRRPPVVFLPARARGEALFTPPGAGVDAGPVPGLLRDAVARAAEGGRRRGTNHAAIVHGVVAGLEAWRDSGHGGVVLLMEDPELFLPPQTQRHLYRVLRSVAALGNQVIYSTHSPAFLNVVRLDELVFTERRADVGTLLLQPEPLPADEEFRAYSEFDSSRSELFLARAAVLVEGLTEKLTLPFVFDALGHDPDRERISIVECGGKGNIPLFARISRAVGVPFVALHDRDAPAGEEPSEAERILNDEIGDVAGDDRVELAPDFEGVAGIHGDRRKPARAWRRFSDLDRAEVPEPLARVVERAVALASR
jgi:energy-coupling factor transporter ATP-binding protein EcfA2